MDRKALQVLSKNVHYAKKAIFSFYQYHKNDLTERDATISIVPKTFNYIFRTKTRVPKTGLLLIGLGGNNGSTLVAGVLANRSQLSWETKNGLQSANYLGSLTQSATLKMGDSAGKEIFLPFHQVMPLLDPNEIAISGWDINAADLRQASARAKVFPVELQRKLGPVLEKIRPMRSIYYPDFIAANQSERANNCIPGDRPCLEHLEAIRKDIRAFKAKNGLEKVIVLWTANTERFSQVSSVHQTEEEFMRGVKEGHPEISPSQMFAMASILEHCSYINGSPQNTLVPAIRNAARKRGVFVVGDDFKSGQTKVKSVLVDFLVSAGIRPESIVSYNHLGNNDGKNLSSQKQFHSKEISKSNVVDDILASNSLLYQTPKSTAENGTKPLPIKRKKPDHCVVIKYVPFVEDSKRAMDEYTSSIFMGGMNTMVLHNTCEDSLLAAPIIIDLVVLTEFFERVSFVFLGEQTDPNSFGWTAKGEQSPSDGVEIPPEIEELLSPFKNSGRYEQLRDAFCRAGPFSSMDSVLSALSYLMKAPRVPKETPVVNALFRQRACLESIFRACLGLQPESHSLLEHKCRFQKAV